jgi:TetR/AcrR family transcriptional repressor of uid operon
MPVTTIDRYELPTDELAARILDATMTCLSRFGVAKTTADDVAREAGCSRASVYRYFANRNALVTAAVDRELAVLTAAVIAAADQADTLEDAVVAMFITAARHITAHEALQRALELEPEVVLPSLSFEGGDRLFAEATTRFGPALERFVPPDRAPRAAEWCTRVLLAYLHPERSPLSMIDDDSVRALVRRHVVPAVSPHSISPTR